MARPGLICDTGLSPQNVDGIKICLSSTKDRKDTNVLYGFQRNSVGHNAHIYNKYGKDRFLITISTCKSGLIEDNITGKCTLLDIPTSPVQVLENGESAKCDPSVFKYCPPNYRCEEKEKVCVAVRDLQSYYVSIGLSGFISFYFVYIIYGFLRVNVDTQTKFNIDL